MGKELTNYERNKILRQQKKDWDKRNLDGYSFAQGVSTGFLLFVAFLIWFMVFIAFNVLMFITLFTTLGGI
jgi:polyferredoxin